MDWLLRFTDITRKGEEIENEHQQLKESVTGKDENERIIQKEESK